MKGFPALVQTSTVSGSQITFQIRRCIHFHIPPPLLFRNQGSSYVVSYRPQDSITAQNMPLRHCSHDNSCRPALRWNIRVRSAVDTYVHAGVGHDNRLRRRWIPLSILGCNLRIFYWHEPDDETHEHLHLRTKLRETEGRRNPDDGYRWNRSVRQLLLVLQPRQWKYRRKQVLCYRHSQRQLAQNRPEQCSPSSELLWTAGTSDLQRHGISAVQHR